jgi:hypothetical protein
MALAMLGLPDAIIDRVVAHQSQPCSTRAVSGDPAFEPVTTRMRRRRYRIT